MDPVVSLQDLPVVTAFEVVKRLNTQSFVRSIRTCKWVNQMIESRRHTFVKNIQKCVSIDKLDEKQIEACRYYKLSNIESNFIDKIQWSQILPQYKTANIFADQFTFHHSLAVPEIFDYFKPKRCSFWLSHVSHHAWNCYIAPGLAEITFHISDNYEPGEIDTMCDNYIGKSRRLVVECYSPLTFLIVETFAKAVAHRGQDQDLVFSLNKGFDSSEVPIPGPKFHYRRIEFVDQRYKVPGTFHLYIFKVENEQVAVAAVTEVENANTRFHCVHVRSVEEVESKFIPLLTINNSEVLNFVAKDARLCFQ